MTKSSVGPKEINIVQKYRALFENAPVGIAIINNNREIIESNHTLRRIIRLPEEEIERAGLKKRKYLHPDGSEFRVNEIPSIIAINEGRAVNNIEIAISENDEVICWVNVSAAPVDIPERCAVVITQDITERKNLELKIKSGEEKFRAFFESSLDAMLIVSPDGEIYSANSAASRMVGYTQEEICRMGRNELMDLGDPRLDNAIAERQNYGKFYGELTMIRKNGEKFPIELSAAVYTHENGKKKTGLIVREITNRKKAEALLEKSEAEFRSLFENSLMGISQSLPNGKFIRINSAYAQMYGYPDTVTMLNEIAYGSKKLFSNPDDRKKVLETLNEKGIMPPREFVLNKRNGEKFWALVGAKNVTDEMGNLLYLQAEHIDITQFKKVEEKWLDSEEKYRLLSDQSGLGIGLYSPEGKIIYLNTKAKSYLDETKQDYTGKSLSEVFGERSNEVYFNRLNDVLKAEESIEYEDFYQSETQKLWFISNHSRVFSSKGELIGIQVISHDITERKVIEKQLHESTEELRQLTHHFGEEIEKERSGIARDLHDDLGQKLTALNMDIAWLKTRIGVQSRTVEKKMQQIQSIISETIESVQRISYGLRPSILNDLGLQSAVEWQLKEFNKLSGINVNSVFDIENEISDRQISLVIFRIVQEALTNILRHAGATAVDVEIIGGENEISARISDNGSGIENEKIVSKKSFGLIGMRERVKAYEGEIIISGKEGLGTEIFVKIPFKV